MQDGFGGYRVVHFTDSSKKTLREIAEILRPHQDAIVERWVATQLAAYRPPRLTPQDVRALFGSLFGRMLQLLSEGSPDAFIGELHDRGAELASREFPYEALLMSIHFLEEAYMPYLIEDDEHLTRERFVWMDEFMHVALGALATSYFQAFRDSLLGQAEVGRIVQEGLMPRIPARVADLDVGFAYQSATEQALVGGDVLDVFSLTPAKAAFVVGDVSGHGVSAAKDGALLRSLFRGFVRTCGSLAEAVESVNAVLVAELEPGAFISALFGVYELGGRLRVVNAGHPRPLLCGSQCGEIAAEGAVLGVLEGEAYSEAASVLEPGELLFGYTDGLTEARSGGGFFGEGRIAESLGRVRGALPQVVADHVRADVLTFAGDHLEDDVAILALGRRR